jgi:urea transporter/murein DD-endopeptidase MepM/ murein hydrolase activator NlpD
MSFFVDSILFSYGQIFFSNRRWFGGLLLFSTFISPEIGLTSLLGVIISNSTAIVLRYDRVKIKSGFYGFNGILFGASVVFFYKLDLQLLGLAPLFIVIVFLLASVLENYFATAFNLPGLSIPFVISLYVFIIFLSNYDSIVAISPKNFNEYFTFIPLWLQNYFKSLALILFQPNILTGIIISIGLIFFSRILFLLSVVSFILNVLFLNLILPQHSDALVVITGFNSILTVLALGGSLIIPSKKSFALAVFSILLAIIFTGFFTKLLHGSLPVLVLPFNFIVLFTLFSLRFRQEQSGLVALYFAPGSPEENYYYHHNRLKRFERFKNYSPELPFFGEWHVSQGYKGKHTHKDKWRYALDFVVTDDNGKESKTESSGVSEYFCYALPVLACLDGEVVRVIDGIPDNNIGDINLETNWGNTVIIKHGENLYSSISHLKESSTKVKVGDFVKKGNIIGLCGNSGRSPYPHIHFQFQQSDKLGDVTLEYSFAHYFAKTESGLELKIFESPDEGMRVRNIEVHKSIKEAFSFTLGEKIKLECTFNRKSFSEEWEVKVDIYNSQFLESSDGNRAYFFNTDKLFYFISYTGKKNTALYYFYLAAHQIPFSFHKDIYWLDRYSIVDLPKTNFRYPAEFFLHFKNFFLTNARFSFAERNEEDEYFRIRNNIEVGGLNLFRMFNRRFSSVLEINSDGSIQKIEFYEKDVITFKAKIISN